MGQYQRKVKKKSSVEMASVFFNLSLIKHDVHNTNTNPYQIFPPSFILFLFILLVYWLIVLTNVVQFDELTKYLFCRIWCCKAIVIVIKSLSS